MGFLVLPKVSTRNDILRYDSENIVKELRVLEFYEICDSSTEFHFPNISEQLETLKVQIKDAISWRNSCQHPGSLTAVEQQVQFSAYFYIVFRCRMQ